MLDPDESPEQRERFISLLVSGCSERLGRALALLEPVLDASGELVQEPDPDNPGKTRPKLRRIEHINPHEHFSEFCAYLRDLPGQEAACQHCSEKTAHLAMQAAQENPRELDSFLQGYPCRMGLIDQAAVILYSETPVAVMFSGQFLSDGDDSRKEIRELVEQLAIQNGFSEAQRQELMTRLEKLETRDEFARRFLRDLEIRKPEARSALGEPAPSAAQLFQNEAREIERIVGAQFQMHKRHRESTFRHDLRAGSPALALASREKIREHVEPLFARAHRFFGTTFLALFISPQRYISYESNPNLLQPFVLVDVRPEVQAGVLHFNWRKADLDPAASPSADAEEVTTETFAGMQVVGAALTKRDDLLRALRRGLKGEKVEFFEATTGLYQMYLSDAHRAVLLWGAFPHLTAHELEQERHFLEETSELLMVRVLSLVQLSDSEHRTSALSDVAVLLAHYSRRAMNPLSTGVRIISSVLEGKKTYSKDDALDACASLETAAKFVSDAVRAPLASFAATAEKVYRFEETLLDSIVQSCVALFRPIAMEKSVTIEVDASVSALPRIEADTAKIGNAIGYVLDNAVKYSHEHKKIRIYAGLFGDRVQLTIEDFGQGIDEDERKLIFGRGVQGKRSRRALHEEGEGMGLFHARLIVEAHGGRIWCGCRSGTRTDTSARLEGYRVWFTFELPVKWSGGRKTQDEGGGHDEDPIS